MPRYYPGFRPAMLATLMLFFMTSNPGQAIAQNHPRGGSSHCYATITFGNGCASVSPSRDCLQGFRTAITVRPTTHGDGLLSTEFWLNSFSTGDWIEVGYWSTVYEPTPHYFWAESSQGNILIHFITNIPQQDFGSVARLEISRILYYGWPINKDLFRISINSATVSFSTLIFDDMWSGAGRGYVTVGQELYGTNGASSPQQVFYDFAYLDPKGNWQVDSQKSQVASDNPPYGSWLVDPIPGVAGIFTSRCCQATSALTGQSFAQSVDPRSASSPLDETWVTGAQTVQPEIPRHAFRGRERKLREFALKTPIPKIEDQGDRTVTRFECSLIARDLDGILSGRMIGIHPDRRICYIELRGTFVSYAPPSV